MTPNPMESMIRPSQVNWNQPQEDTAITELANAMSKMTAHIADLDKRMSQCQQPVQRFTADIPTSGTNRTPIICQCCKQNRYTSQVCHLSDLQTCFKCGEQGHISTW